MRILLDRLSLSLVDVAKLSAKGSRPSLATIRVEETRCVATDGHMLVGVEHPKLNAADFPVAFPELETPDETPFRPFSLEADTASRILASIPKGGQHAILNSALLQFTPQADAEGGDVVAYVTDLGSPMRINARAPHLLFPDWRKVMPKETDRKPTECVGLSMHFLAVISKIARACREHGNGDPVLTLRPCASGAVYITTPGAPRFWALLMPVRDPEDSPKPAPWAEAAEEPAPPEVPAAELESDEEAEDPEPAQAEATSTETESQEAALPAPLVAARKALKTQRAKKVAAPKPPRPDRKARKSAPVPPPPPAPDADGVTVSRWAM